MDPVRGGKADNSEKVPLTDINTGDKQPSYDATTDKDPYAGPMDLVDYQQDDDDKPLVDSLKRSEPGEGSAAARLSSRKRILGFMVCVVAALLDSLSMASVQVLEKSMPDGELNAFRYAAQVVIITPFFLVGKPKCDVKVERHYIKWLVILAVVSNGVNYGRFAATYYLPLGTCSAFGQGLAMIFAWLATLIIFRKPKVLMIPGLIFSVTGVILVMQPEALFGFDEAQYNASLGVVRKSCFYFCHDWSDNSTNFTTPLSAVHSPFGEGLRLSDEVLGYIMLTIYATCLTIINYVINKACASMPVTKLNFWMPVIAVPVALVNMLTLETPTIPACWLCVVAFLCHAFLTGGQSVMRYTGMQIVHPLTGAIIVSSTTTVFNFVLQYTLLQSLHPGHMNWIEYLGAFFTVVGLVLGPVIQLWRETHKPSHAGDEQD